MFAVPVIYSESQHQVIDRVDDGIGFYSGKTLEQLEAAYGPLEVIDIDEAVARVEAYQIEAPAPCTREEFIHALECLPPEGWTRAAGSESFKMSEYYSGRITRIYARVGMDYYTMLNRCDLSHDEIMDKVTEVKKMDNNNMANANRSRLTVNPEGDWQKYQAISPEGWTMLGTVARSPDDVGALARCDRTGQYGLWNEGSMQVLDGRKVGAALGNYSGRPSELRDGKRVNVYLDAPSLATAAKLGEGNVSEGIRIALRKVGE